MLPNEFNFSAGVQGLSQVVMPLIAEPLWLVPGVPDLRQLAMIPTISPNALQRDPLSGPDGYIHFQFTDYYNKMVHWKRRTDRQPYRGGFGGDIRLSVKSVQATEELSASEVFPFAGANVLPMQQKEMAITAGRVIAAFNTARERDRPDFVLVPMAANTLQVWDGEPLFSTNHEHPGGGLFSNDLTAGIPADHMPDMIPPVRNTLTDPTVEEVYKELVFLMTYNSMLRVRISQFQKLQQVWALEVIVNDANTLLRLEDLNRTRRAKFVGGELSSELEDNPFYNRLSITRNWGTPEAGQELMYQVIPQIEVFDREPGVAPENPLALPVWNPVPRPLVFSVVRQANRVDTHYDEWNDPVSAMIGIWEMWAYGAGFAEEIVRFDPDTVQGFMALGAPLDRLSKREKDALKVVKGSAKVRALLFGEDDGAENSERKISPVEDVTGQNELVVDDDDESPFEPLPEFDQKTADEEKVSEPKPRKVNLRSRKR